MNKAILWDLDGTLLYTLQDLTNATNATLRAFGLAERSLEEVRTFVGNGAIQQMRRAVGESRKIFRRSWPITGHTIPSTATKPPVHMRAFWTPPLRCRRRGGVWPLSPTSRTMPPKPSGKPISPTFDLALGEGPDLPGSLPPDMVLRALEQLETPWSGPFISAIPK